MDDLEKLGVRIRTLRKLSGYTQEQLSEKVGRTVSAVSSIERGTTRPSIETLLRLPEALDVSLSDLFDFEGCRDEGRRDESLRVAYLTTLTTLARSLETPELGWAAEVVKTMAMQRMDSEKGRQRG